MLSVEETFFLSEAKISKDKGQIVKILEVLMFNYQLITVAFGKLQKGFYYVFLIYLVYFAKYLHG